MEETLENDKCVSVIVPIYNVTEYLEKCLDSIESQTYQNLQIILVNDGSTDSSGEICKEHAAQDARITYISQPNSGVTAARKAGLAQAAGDYVVFVDADDWMENGFIEALYLSITNTQSDITVADYIRCYPYGDFVFKNQVCHKTYDDVEEIIPDVLYYQDTNQFGLFPYIWGKIFKRQLIAGAIDTIEDKMQYAEDLAATLWCVIHAGRITILDDIQYHHVIRDGSIATSEDGEFLIKISLFYIYAKRLFEQQTQNEHLLKQLDKYVITNVLEGIN
ncbi:MAG: glycosyltransferase, partial [Bacteroidales bacterium]|nr:glycosyltransferase [Bacteroidales bacterium]